MSDPRAVFPLNWPVGQARLDPAARRIARFSAPFDRAYNELLDELERMGATAIVVSSNVPLRGGFAPDARALAAADRVDPAVAVHFTVGNTPYCVACDSYTRAAWNLRAIGLHVAALRTIARHGVSELLQQTLHGFRVLPAAATANQTCWEILGVPSTATLTEIGAAAVRMANACTDDVAGGRVFRALIEARNVAARSSTGAVLCLS